MADAISPDARPDPWRRLVLARHATVKCSALARGQDQQGGRGASAKFRLESIACQLFGCDAKVAELVDALDLGSSGATRESSSLSVRTNSKHVIANAITRFIFMALMLVESIA